MAKKTDAQADRSRQWLVDSLFALMAEKSFEHITISEIADRAQLDRRTFYRHFKTKDDIIRYQIKKLAASYERIFHVGRPIGTSEIALSFFTICRENQSLLQVLHKQNRLFLLLAELSEIFPAFHYKYHISPEPYAEMQVDPRYALAYHIGGFWNILNLWLADGCAKTPDELSHIIGAILPARI